MAVSWGLVAPPVAAGNPGDVFIHTPTNDQFRWDGTANAWVPLQPGETRGDTLPIAGGINLHLAKGANRSWDNKWVNASEGLVFTENYSGQTWEVVHRLGARFVDVTVIAPGNHNAAAPQTIIVPEILFDSTLRTVLTFAAPVAGTAIVRR